MSTDEESGDTPMAVRDDDEVVDEAPAPGGLTPAHALPALCKGRKTTKY